MAIWHIILYCYLVADVFTHCVEPVLFALCKDDVLVRGDDDPAQALTAILSALSWAMWRLRSSSCWLHLWFCSLRCWFWASKSLSLLVTHSLMRAAFASTILASWSLSWRYINTHHHQYMLLIIIIILIFGPVLPVPQPGSPVC